MSFANSYAGKADKMGRSRNKKRARWEYRAILKSMAKRARRENDKKAARNYE